MHLCYLCHFHVAFPSHRLMFGNGKPTNAFLIQVLNVSRAHGSRRSTKKFQRHSQRFRRSHSFSSGELLSCGCIVPFSRTLAVVYLHHQYLPKNFHRGRRYQSCQRDWSTDESKTRDCRTSWKLLSYIWAFTSLWLISVDVTIRSSGMSSSSVKRSFTGVYFRSALWMKRFIWPKCAVFLVIAGSN